MSGLQEGLAGRSEAECMYIIVKIQSRHRARAVRRIRYPYVPIRRYSSNTDSSSLHSGTSATWTRSARLHSVCIAVQWWLHDGTLCNTVPREGFVRGY